MSYLLQSSLPVRLEIGNTRVTSSNPFQGIDNCVFCGGCQTPYQHDLTKSCLTLPSTKIQYVGL
jgi:hypothetical protein